MAVVTGLLLFCVFFAPQVAQAQGIPQPIDGESLLPNTQLVSATVEAAPDSMQASEASVASLQEPLVSLSAGQLPGVAAPGHSLLAYVGLDGFLYLADPGSAPFSPLRLTHLTNVETPTWSHSATKLAFSAVGQDSTRCLYTVDLNKLNSIQQLFCGFEEITYPVWSPTDSYLAFYGYRAGGAKRAWLVSSTGESLQELGATLTQVEYPVWLDPQRIAFPADKGGRVWAIHTATVDAPTQVQAFPGEIRCPAGCSCGQASIPLIAYPDVSADGSKIGFMGIRDTGSCRFTTAVYQMPTNGTEPPVAFADVTPAGRDSRYGWLKWSPDNLYVSLISTASDDIGRVRVIDLRDNSVRTFDPKVPVPNGLDWAPDASTLATGFGTSSTNSQVYAINPISGTFALLAPGKRPDWAPANLQFIHTLSGRVTDQAGSPLSDVVLAVANGLTATTTSNGDYTISGLLTGTYTLAPLKQGYIFSPTVRSITVPPSLQQQDFVGRAVEQLLAYYSFDDFAATDHSGNGYHGVLRNGVQPATGLARGALAFDGTNDAVTTPLNLDQASSSTGVTLMAWVYPTTISGGRHHVISSDNGGYDWSILREGGTWHVFTGEGSRSTGFTVDVQQWQHVAATFTPGQGIRFYKNGEEFLLPQLSFDSSDNKVGIGHNPGYGEYFGGLIDEVYIFGRSLSTEEIQAAYRDVLDHYTFSIGGRITDGSGNPLAAVTLVNSESTPVHTDASGIYTFTQLLTGTYVITPGKLGYFFAPPTQTVSLPPDATQDFIGTAVSVTTMTGTFYHINAQAGGTATLGLALHENQAAGYLNFTQIPPRLPPLCGAGNFLGAHSSETVAFSLISNDTDSGCGFDHGASFAVDARINQPLTHIEGSYMASNAGTSSLVESPGVFEAWTLGSQPQRRHYVGDFTNTTYNLSGVVTVDVVVGTNTVSGHMNFSGYPGGRVLCGAGDFAGITDGASLKYTFITTDADPGCSPDGRTGFLIEATFAEGQSKIVGTYETSNNQGGVFEVELPTYSVSGKVTDADGAPIPGVSVLASFFGTGVTDAIGNYTIRGLEAGTYAIRPALEGYEFEPPDKPIQVPPDVTGLHFIGKPFYSVSGYVHDWQNSSLSGIQIALQAVDGSILNAYTRADGSYLFEHISSGIYTLSLGIQSDLAFVMPSSTVIVTNQHVTDANLQENEPEGCTRDRMSNNIVDGICVYHEPDNKYYMTVIDLSNPHIKLELAYEDVDTVVPSGRFYVKPTEQFVRENSGAGQNGQIIRSYVAINGIARDRLEDINIFSEYMSDSILGMKGFVYDETGICYSNEECQFEYGAGFFKYSTKNRPASVEDAFYRETKDFYVCVSDPCTSAEIAAAKAFIRGELEYTDLDFAVGYRNTVLDAIHRDGFLVPGFPEYVAPNTGQHPEHSDPKHRTLIGMSCDASTVFFATVFTNMETARLVRDLYNRGACRAIMLDGGESSQFSGVDQNRQSYNYAPLTVGCLFRWGSRCNINAIVAYNSSQLLGPAAKILATSAGKYLLASEALLSVTSGTFLEDVHIEYMPVLPHHQEGFAHVNRFFDITAQTLDGSAIQPTKPYTIFVTYDDQIIPSGLDEAALGLYNWNADQNAWQREPTSTVNIDTNTVTATPNHFSQWALLIEVAEERNNNLYLPLVNR